MSGTIPPSFFSASHNVMHQAGTFRKPNPFDCTWTLVKHFASYAITDSSSGPESIFKGFPPLMDAIWRSCFAVCELKVKLGSTSNSIDACKKDSTVWRELMALFDDTCATLCPLYLPPNWSETPLLELKDYVQALGLAVEQLVHKGDVPTVDGIRPGDVFARFELLAKLWKLRNHHIDYDEHCESVWSLLRNVFSVLECIIRDSEVTLTCPLHGCSSCVKCSTLKRQSLEQEAFEACWKLCEDYKNRGINFIWQQPGDGVHNGSELYRQIYSSTDGQSDDFFVHQVLDKPETSNLLLNGFLQISEPLGSAGRTNDGDDCLMSGSIHSNNIGYNTGGRLRPTAADWPVLSSQNFTGPLSGNPVDKFKSTSAIVSSSSPSPSDNPMDYLKPTLAAVPSPSPSISGNLTDFLKPTLAAAPSPSSSTSGNPTDYIVPTVTAVPSSSPSPSDNPMDYLKPTLAAVPSTSPSISGNPTDYLKPTLAAVPSPSPSISGNPTDYVNVKPAVPSPSPSISGNPTDYVKPTVTAPPSPSPSISGNPTDYVKPTVTAVPSPSPSISGNPTDYVKPTVTAVPSPSPSPSVADPKTITCTKCASVELVDIEAIHHIRLRILVVRAAMEKGYTRNGPRRFPEFIRDLPANAFGEHPAIIHFCNTYRSMSLSNDSSLKGKGDIVAHQASIMQLKAAVEWKTRLGKNMYLKELFKQVVGVELEKTDLLSPKAKTLVVTT